MKIDQSSSECGSAMLEFAVSAIVLFTLIFGCMALALALYSYEVVNQYARDASRYAVVHGNGCVAAIDGSSCNIGVGDYTDGAQGGSPTGGAPADSKLLTFLNTEGYPGINGSNLTITTAYAPAPSLTSCFATNCNGSGDQVTVTVSYPYLYAIPFVPQRSFTMHASSTMVISQ